MFFLTRRLVLALVGFLPFPGVDVYGGSVTIDQDGDGRCTLLKEVPRFRLLPFAVHPLQTRGLLDSGLASDVGFWEVFTGTHPSTDVRQCPSMSRYKHRLKISVSNCLFPASFLDSEGSYQSEDQTR
ncbi:hypothetical protein BDN70DRAFT_870122 [Pholiota conissans]|uniref:Uncharacterized protein n=1 Tax=Pholiota conissans TaxID=109636 RepID=A0A9P5ZIL3_9AGAR|nr:hypothetical protein BDN70DRAFT_870122 [Pholiota conissans]